MKNKGLAAPRSGLFWEQNKQTVFVLIFLVALLFASNMLNPGFLTMSHMENLLRQASFLGIVAIGQTLVILSGGIDMSVSYVITFANILAASILMGRDANTPLALLTVLLVGAVIGLANGAGVHFLKIPPMIMTLGIGNVVYGLSFLYSGGAPRGKTSPWLDAMANKKIGGIINGSLLLWIVLAVVVVFLLRKTTIGRMLYCIGSNPVAAFHSGVKVGRMTIVMYTISGVMAALAGFLLLGYTGTSYFSTGDPYAMDSVAAVVVGGTSIAGGQGGYAGTIIGVIITVVITSLMTILNMPESGRKIVQGAIIILLLLSVKMMKKG